jgi:hypothetical protein
MDYKEMKAYDAGRASRDAEVESIRADRDALHKVWEAAFGARSFREVQADVEALRADAERLDWLTKNFYSRENLDWITGKVSTKETMWVFFAPIGQQGNIRTVLDAARAAQEE